MRRQKKLIKEMDILINRWNVLWFFRETRQTESGGGRARESVNTQNKEIYLNIT